MRVFISRRSRRAAWERGAAVRAQHNTSLSTEQDSGCTQGHEGLPGSHEAPLHLKPEQIWVLKQELDLVRLVCVVSPPVTCGCVEVGDRSTVSSPLNFISFQTAGPDNFNPTEARQLLLPS